MSSGLVGRPGGTTPEQLLGAQRPRIVSVPAYVTSSGPYAVDLAARIGQPSDDWQAYVLVEGLGEDVGGKWAATEVVVIVSRQNGKGAIVERRIVAGLSLFDEELIIYSAHQFRTTQEMFRRTLNMVQASPDLNARVTRAVRSTNELGIEFRGGQRVRFLARSVGAGRGFSADCIILDEAYNLDTRHMDAIVPTVLARPNPQIWYLSSGGMLASVQLGRLRRRGLARDPSLAFFEWSARAKILGDDTDDDFSDPEVWAKANPGLGTRLSLATLGLMYRTDPSGFPRECLGVGEYPPDDDEAGWEVISERAWLSCADTSPGIFDPDIELAGPVAMSLDVTPDRSWTSIGAVGCRLDGRLHVQVIDHRPGTEWAPERAAELGRRWGPCVFAVDKSGPAASLIPALIRAGVTVTTLSTGDVVAGCGHFVDLVAADKVRHLGQRELNAAVKGARKRDVGDKAWAWARRGVDVVISPLVAVGQAAYGFEVHGSSGFFGGWR